MTVFDAIVQGIIQGATEFLPVSSSGHLSLFNHFTGASGEEAVLTTITLHLGTLIAVFIAFWDKIKRLVAEGVKMLGDIFTGKFSFKNLDGERRMIMMIIASILPLFPFYLFRSFFTGVQNDGDICVEGLCFLYTAVILTVGDRISIKNREKGLGKDCTGVKLPEALIIGAFQGVALLPGVSRSGSTISAGLMSGLKRSEAVEYSFILGIPVILAAAVTEIPHIAGESSNIEVVPLLVGMAAAAVSGYFAIRLIRLLMKSDKFGIFAVYTFILGIVVFGIGLYEHFGSANL